MRFNTIHCALALTAFAAPALAQSNMIPGTDVELGLLTVGSDWAQQGHEGPALAGEAAFSMSTTSCNPGSVNVPWIAAMGENHPLIAFMAVREEADQSRLVQISDRSWLKHGFFALSNSQCTPCQNPSGGTFLGVGCSDTYGIGNNSNRFDLGPPEEIDPWLGTWASTGSFFDCPTGTGCDGNRSYNGSESSALTSRVRIQDSDLNVPGATFAYYGYYVIRGEPEANRTNNGNSRNFVPTWNGSGWNTSEGGTNPHVQGTILQRWTGANVTSNVNNNGGQDRDGRVYVASKVSGSAPNFHYEYAFHNRDNNGGISEFRIPVGAGVNVTGFGFHDVDQSAANDWSASVVGTEIVFSTTSNPLAWNTVYNVWFDADAAPVARDITLTQFTQNPGAAASFTVANVGPDGPVGPAAFADACNGDGGDQMGCTDCPCGNNALAGTIGGCMNSAFSSTRLMPSGNPSVAADTMRFEVSGMPPFALGVLNSGDQLAPTNPANACFGLDSGAFSIAFDGLRCSVTNTRRHGGRGADFSGNIGLTNAGWGFGDNPPGGLVAQGGYVAGQTRHYQLVYREDPSANCMTGLSTSQAVTTNFMP